MIIGNVFVQCESRGMPLEIAIDVLNDNNCVISWIDFYYPRAVKPRNLFRGYKTQVFCE